MSAIEERMQELRKMADDHAEAQAQREYLSEFRKSKKAILMKDAEVDGFKTTASQEREAYAHADYLELLQGLKVATEKAVRLRWRLDIAKAGIELYRTQQANQRAERKGYGA